MSDFTDSLRKFSGFNNQTDFKASARGDTEQAPIPAWSNPVEQIATPPVKAVAPAPVPMTEAEKLALDIGTLNSAVTTSKNMAKFNLSRERDNDLTKNNQIVQDRNSLDPFDFRAKWGADVAEKMDVLDRAGMTLKDQENAPRSWPQAIGDSAIDVVNGAFQGVGGIAVATGKLLGDTQAIQDYSGGMKKVNDYLTSKQSTALNDSRKINALREELDKSDEDAKYEQEKATDGDFVASLRSIGRNSLDTGGRLIEDPRLIGSLASQGLGSMVVAGPAGRAIAAGAGAVGANLAARSGMAAGALTAEGVGSAGAAEALQGSSTLAAIGAMEGGGAYAQVAQEIQALPDARLQEQSPDYKALRQTMDEQEAKSIMIDRAGTPAMLIAGTTGILTSKAFGTHNIEGNLAKTVRNGPVAALRDTAKETAEEGIQGATGQAAQNIGNQVSGVNPNQSLIEGVGQSVVEGAVAGALSSATLQAPGAVAQATGDALSAAGRSAMDTITERADRIRAENEAGSKVSTENVSQDFQAATQAVPEAVEALKTLVETAPAPEATPEASQANSETVPQDTQALLKRVEEATQITAEDAASLPKHIAQKVMDTFNEFNTDPDRKVPNRFEAMYVNGLIANDETASPEDRVSAATFLLRQFNKQSKLFSEDLPAALANVKQNSAEYTRFNEWASVIGMVTQEPGILKAYEWAQSGIPAELNKVNTEANITPQTVETVVQLSDVAPDLIPEKVLTGVLKQSEEGTITLAPEARQKLLGTQVLQRAVQAGEQAQSDLGISPGVSLVTKQIESTGGDKPHMHSLKQYVDLISNAQDDNTRKSALNNLGGFARAMRNKVAALNESIADNGKKKTYQSWGPFGWITPEKTSPLYVNTKSANSLNTAKTIYADAVAVAELANQMSVQYPQFNIQPVVIPALELGGVNSKGISNPEPQDLTATTPSNAAVDQNQSSDRQEEIPSLPSTEAASTETSTTETAATANQETVVQEEEANTGEQTENKTVEPEAQQTTETVYPDLRKSKDKNWFQSAYKISQKNLSRIKDLANPLEPFLNNEKLSDNSKRLLNKVEDILKSMNNRLSERLNKPSKTGTLNDLLKNNSTDVLRFRDTLALNITNEKGEYDPRLATAAALAGLDFFINGLDNLAENSKDDIAEISGISADNISDADVANFNRGSSVDFAKQSLGSLIQRYWGVESDKSVSDSLTKGIVESIAAEILGSMEEQGMIKLGRVDLRSNDDVKSFGRVWFDNRNGDDQIISQIKNRTTKVIADGILTLRADLKKEGNASFISDAVLAEKEARGPLREPPKNTEQTQLRNAMALLTKSQKKMIDAKNNEAYYPNFNVYEFMKSFGKENFVALMAGKMPDPSKLNVSHMRSVEGVIRSLETSYDNMIAQVTELENYANENGMDREDVPSYFAHAITKVGRLQQIGASNPVSDKLLREIFMPTRSVLDMTFQKGQDAFWMTVGQGLGIKTEYKFRSQVRAEAEALIESRFRPVIEEIKAWMQEGGTLPASIIDGMMAHQGISMHGVHSLISVAALENTPEEKREAFQHFNYLEADGKTNGPINSLFLLATGGFTGKWLDDVAKGGAYIGENAPKSLNQYYNEDQSATGGKNKQDLYASASTVLQRLLNETSTAWKNTNPRMTAQYASFSRIFSKLLSDEVSFNVEDGTLEIKRGAIKNPLTISIYGSGINGINNKIVDSMTEVLAEKFSDLVADERPITDLFDVMTQGNLDLDPTVRNKLRQEFENDLRNILTFETRTDKKTGQVYLVAPKEDIKSAWDKFQKMNPQEAVIPTELTNILKSNVRQLYTNQLAQAIDESVMSHVRSARNALMSASQVQGISYRSMFRDKVIALLADKQVYPEKYPEYKKGDSLSQQEVSSILKELLPFAPITETETQNFFFAGGESTQLFEQAMFTDEAKSRSRAVSVKHPVTGETVKITLPEEFARSLKGDLSSPAYIYGPTLVGVRAVPSTVIGMGDSESILQAVAKGVKGLAVYDGWNMPADKLDEYGVKLNESVNDAWNKNAMRAVSNSFKAFLRANPIDAIMGDNPLNTQQKIFTDAISKVFSLENATVEDIRTEMAELSRSLEIMADEIDARQQVIREYGISVDQMASAEAPYYQKGTKSFPEGATNETKAALMTARYNEILAQKEQITEPRIAAESPAIAEAVASDTGVRVVPIQDLRSVLQESMGSLTKTQQEMLDASLDVVSDSSYRVVFGTAENLRAWEQLNNADRYTGDEYTWGKVDTVSKIIFISSMSAETIVHELIHASTYDKVQAYYNNPTVLDAEQRAAIKRLELLMQEWLGQSYASESSGAQQARATAETTILNHLSKGQKAAGLNEFMAWVLSNQSLAEVASKTKVSNPQASIIGRALKAVKDLIWGLNKAPKAGDNLLAQLRFNTRILTDMPSLGSQVQTAANEIALHHSASFGSSDYLSGLIRDFNTKLFQYINEPKNAAERFTREFAEEPIIDRNAAALIQTFEKSFPMTLQEAYAFKAIYQALAVDTQINKNALNRINEVYTEVVKQLDANDFLTGTTDPQVDQYQANEKYNTLLGVNGITKDKLGRSSLLPSFLALALTNEQFRSILAKKQMPKTLKDESGTFDALLTNLGTAAMDRLSLIASGDRNSPNIQIALDNLSRNLINNVGDTRTQIELTTGNGLDSVDKMLSDYIQRFADNREEAASKRLETSTNRTVRGLARAERFVASIVSEKSGAKLALGALQAINSKEGLFAVRALIDDLIGENENNTGVYGLLSKVRTTVQQYRQDFREKLPQIVSEQFSKKLDQKTWVAMNHGFAKTDVASLLKAYSREQVLEFFTNERRLNRETKALETEITAADPLRANAIFAKAQQLTTFMNTGVPGRNLLRNAHAVAHLFEERQKQAPGEATAIVNMVDQLVSLYAIQGLNLETKSTLASLVQEENKGVTFVLDYLTGLRTDELSKANDDITLYNHFKGHIPSVSKEGAHLLVAPESEHARLTKLGYIRVGDYKGSSADFGTKKRSYYFSAVNGQKTYNQGAIQTVHQTVSGINPLNGYSVGTVNAGIITDGGAVTRMRALVRNEAPTSESLMPVFKDGNVVAYERAVDPKQLALMAPDDALHTMMGVWRGRQFEERLAQEYNNVAIDKLHENWEQGKKDNRQKEYVKLEDSKDPIIAEAWKLIPYAAREHIKTRFGKEGFMVRKEMLNNAVGYRQASVGDIFTGQTRWNPSVQKQVENIALSIFGNQAYMKLVKAEGFAQNLISNAKVMIVVKSVIVPVANIMSNVLLKTAKGVPMRDIFNGYKNKTPEVNFYIKSRSREVQIDAEILAAQGAKDDRQERKLRIEKQAIQDAFRRLSIWPLIEAGEFGAISDGIITSEDLSLADGRWGNYVEKLAQKIPEGPLKTVYRNAFITKDTAIFQGLSRAVQYGDFLSKTILYDDLIKRQGISQEEAIRQVRNDFVNYNLLTGRDRQYLESVGLLWFYNYKLRSAKVALETMRNRPLTSLLMMGVSSNIPMLDVGTPFTDNIVSVAADGRLGYSIGPQMGFHSFQLNPWINLTR